MGVLQFSQTQCAVVHNKTYSCRSHNSRYQYVCGRHMGVPAHVSSLVRVLLYITPPPRRCGTHRQATVSNGIGGFFHIGGVLGCLPIIDSRPPLRANDDIRYVRLNAPLRVAKVEADVLLKKLSNISSSISDQAWFKRPWCRTVSSIRHAAH